MVKIRRGTKNDTNAIAQLLLDTWRLAYRDIMPHDFLNGLDLAKQIKRHATYFDRGINYFIAENKNGDLIGFASYGKNRIEIIDFMNYIPCTYMVIFKDKE